MAKRASLCLGVIAIISVLAVDGFMFSPTPAGAVVVRRTCSMHSSDEAISRNQFLAGTVVATLLWNPQIARADGDGKAAEAAAKAARAAAVRRKIEASKQNYRTASKLMQERKGVDYSCVAATGSPCSAQKQNDATNTNASKSDMQTSK